MIVAAFKYKVNPKFQEEFERLYGFARKHVGMIDGYEGHEVFRRKWASYACCLLQRQSSFLIWDEHPEHKKYKERGKTNIFESYDVSVGEVFERHIK
jgi:heme-degrading monooxygenase HmoA